MLPKPALLTQIYEPRAAALSTKSHPHLKINPANTAQLYGDRPVLNVGSPLISGGADWLGCALGSSVSYMEQPRQCLCFTRVLAATSGITRGCDETSAVLGKKTCAFPESFHQHNCGTFVGFWSSFLIPQLLGSYAWEVSRAPIFF